MTDETEGIRKVMVAALNAQKSDRQVLEEHYGQVWDTNELQQDFIVEGFMAPFIVVTRRKDRQRGSLMFQDYPRYYFKFEKK